jgi:hypothetical protein
MLHVAQKVIEDLTLLDEKQEFKSFAFLFLEKGCDELGEVPTEDGLQTAVVISTLFRHF